MDNLFTKLLDLDNLIFIHIVLIERLPFLDQLIPWINWLAQKGAIWLLILLFLGAFHGINGRKIFFIGIISMALAWGLTEVIKISVGRPRPFNVITDVMTLADVLIEKPASPSFPSGQTSLAFAAGTVLIANSKQKLIKFFVFLLASIIGYSMVYAGVSYPLDVIAGAVLGGLCARLVMGKLNLLNIRRRRRNKYKVP